MLRSLALGAVLAVVGCKSNTRSDDPELGVTNVPSKGSAGGFSASLGAELAGSGAAVSPPTTAPTGSSTGAPAAGSTTTGSPAASNTALGVALAASGSPTGGAGSGTASASGTGTPSGSASGTASGTGAASAGSTGAASGTTGAVSASGSTNAGSTGAGTATGAAPVKVPAELAAIKLSLLPNWERDVGEAGTISLFVNVQRTGQTERFEFHYGYENPSAPVEREMYKKFLADSKLLRVSTDRQRGTAWLLEGRDATGGQAFRMVVVYGGKRLVCYGSLYKDSSLGDVRDEVLIAAKKICESISL